VTRGSTFPPEAVVTSLNGWDNETGIGRASIEAGLDRGAAGGAGGAAPGP